MLYYTAGQVDRGEMLGDEAGCAGTRRSAGALVEGMGHSDIGCEVACIGLQDAWRHAGFIEETGAAQHYRDARITPIYEGTNGIQAADLVTRKLGYQGGAVLLALLADIERDAGDAPALAALTRDCSAIAQWLLGEASLDDKLAGSVPFCTMCAVAVAGWQLLRQEQAATAAGGALGRTKPVVARFFAEHIVPEAAGLKAAALGGAALLYDLSAAELAGA